MKRYQRSLRSRWVTDADGPDIERLKSRARYGEPMALLFIAVNICWRGQPRPLAGGRLMGDPGCSLFHTTRQLRPLPRPPLPRCAVCALTTAHTSTHSPAELLPVNQRRGPGIDVSEPAHDLHVPRSIEAVSTSESAGPSRLATKLCANSARSDSERLNASVRTFSNAELPMGFPLCYLANRIAQPITTCT